MKAVMISTGPDGAHFAPDFHGVHQGKRAEVSEEEYLEWERIRNEWRKLQTRLAELYLGDELG